MKKYKIMALVFAVLTGVSILIFLNVLQKSSRKNYIDVVVTTKQINEQTVLTADMLKLQKMPAEAVHPDAARSIASVTGMITDGKLEKGEAVLQSKLVKSGGTTGGFTYQIPDGMRAITVRVDSVSGAGELVKTGDRVDVLAEIDQQSAQSVDKTAISLMLLQNIEVLATGTDSAQKSSSGGTYTTVTLAVKADDTLRLNLATNTGKIRLTLRPPLDKGTYSYKPKTVSDLS